MKTVTSKVSYRVPDWDFCNHQSEWNPSLHNGTVCRFCVNGKRGAKACALYNEPLDVVDGTLIRKLPSCVRATAGVEACITEPVRVDPKEVIKLVLKEYRKAYASLIAEGYPDVIAHDVATKSLGGLM